LLGLFPGEYILALLHGRRFAPSLVATLLAIVGIASVAHLGVWQLHRAQEKRAILDQMSAGAATTRTLESVDQRLPRYQTVRATGRYDAAHQVLLDSMPSPRGMPGYRVLTPFELGAGGWILVDRGWVPMGRTRAELPKIDVAEDERTIVGQLAEVPRPGLRLGSGQNAAGAGWPRVMNFPEHADLERALERQLGHFVLRLDPAQSDGYERMLAPPPDFGPSRHIAYAVQWFAMGVAMLVIYVLVNLKPKKPDDNASS
jgi:surfeit locus 1 family protein